MSSLYEQSVNPPPPIVWDRPADRIRDQAEAAYNRARNNPAITTEAGLSLIAKAYIAARAGMDGLIPQSQGQRRVDLAALKRKLYGVDDLVGAASPADKATVAISYRDAQQRVAQVESPNELMYLLDNAEQTGDELLARAVGNAALSGGIFGNTDVADKYLSTRPAKAAAWEQLQAASRLPDAATLFEFALPKPSELAALNDSEVAALAAKANAFAAGIGQA